MSESVRLIDLKGLVEVRHCKRATHGENAWALVPYAAGQCVEESTHFASSLEATEAKMRHNASVGCRVIPFVPPAPEETGPLRSRS